MLRRSVHLRSNSRIQLLLLQVRDEVVRVKVVNEKKVLDPMQRTFSTENLTSPGSDCTTSPTSPTSRAWEQYQQKADQWARDDERCAREAEAKASEGERRRSEQIRKAAEELERRNQAARYVPNSCLLGRPLLVGRPSKQNTGGSSRNSSIGSTRNLRPTLQCRSRTLRPCSRGVIALQMGQRTRKG